MPPHSTLTETASTPVGPTNGPLGGETVYPPSRLGRPDADVGELSFEQPASKTTKSASATRTERLANLARLVIIGLPQIHDTRVIHEETTTLL